MKLSDIRTDGGTQPRAAMDQAVVTEYAEDWKSGATFPQVVVYHDGKDFWLADGFHRVIAARVAELDEIEAEIRQGTQRDAILYSVGANGTHGMRRTNEDKRRAVLRLLEDAEWGAWSDREIARRCAVSQPFVSQLRPSLKTVISEDSPTERTYTTKHGTQATMDTSRIGRKPEPKAEPTVWARDEEEQEDEAPLADYDAEVIFDSVCAYIKAALVDAPRREVRHEVINLLVKYLRDMSIRLNQEASA